MSVPDYQSIMLPLLRATADGREHGFAELKSGLAGEFKLAPEDLDVRLPSGKATLWSNRIGWARTYLVKSNLLEATRRLHLRITPRGREVLKSPPERIDARYLRRFPEFVAFLAGGDEGDEVFREPNLDIPDSNRTLTPEEMLEHGHATLRHQLGNELLARLKQVSPSAFEDIIIDLLLAMGYGGSRIDAGRAIGRTGDGGIDGVIEQDRLGLDVVYVQAKRWKNNVGSGEVRDFSGALDENNATKGIIITTAGFSSEARASATKARKRLILIDGQRLAELMIDHDVGVSESQSYSVKRIDLDYFEGE